MQLEPKSAVYKIGEREKERKARTKRLIEIGAVMEHVLGRPIEHGDLPALQEAVEQFEHAEKKP